MHKNEYVLGEEGISLQLCCTACATLLRYRPMICFSFLNDCQAATPSDGAMAIRLTLEESLQDVQTGPSPPISSIGKIYKFSGLLFLSFVSVKSTYIVYYVF